MSPYGTSVWRVIEPTPSYEIRSSHRREVISLRATATARVQLHTGAAHREGCDRIVRIGYMVTRDPVPDGTTQEKLDRILASFTFAP